MKQIKKWFLLLFLVFSLVMLLIVVNKKEVERLALQLETYSLEHNIGKSKLYDIKGNHVFLEDKMIKNSKIIGLTKGYVHSDDQNRIALSLFVNGFCYTKKYQSRKVSVFMGSCKKIVQSYDFTGSEQIFVAPYNGNYEIELWGAAGGKVAYFIIPSMIENKNGRGAYVKGTIHLKEGDLLYVQVGGKGEDGKVHKEGSRFTAFGYPSTGGKGGYNGGGDGFEDPETQAGGGGGGATDIRLVSGTWNDFESLKSRIMVASGGGGMSRFYEYKDSASAGTGESGSGGTLNGKDGKVNLGILEHTYGFGSTQKTGYQFGIGDHGQLCMTTLNGLGGGAGGYYGSYSGRCGLQDWEVPGGAGGASSFVSGCKGCVAITKNSTKDKILFSDSSIHYSGLVFTNITMKSGDEIMPNPISNHSMLGNKRNGYARIRYIGN